MNEQQQTRVDTALLALIERQGKRIEQLERRLAAAEAWIANRDRVELNQLGSRLAGAGRAEAA